MPPAVPLIAAVAGSYIATTGVVALGLAAGSFGASIFGFVVSTAISQLGSRLVGSKPKRQSFASDSQGLNTMVRSSIESHKIIYGQAKLSGPVVLIKTTSSGNDSTGTAVTGDNKFLHLVIALAGHEVDSIPTIYLNDIALELNGSGFATNSPYYRDGYSYARITKHLGATDQIADTNLIAECGVDANFRLRGVAYLYVRLQYSQDIFPSGIPNVSAVVKGKKVYDPRTLTTAWSANSALCIRDYLVSDYGFNCSLDEVDDAYVIAAANICDESVTLKAGGTQSRYTTNGVVDSAGAPLDNLSNLISALAGSVTYVQGQFRVYAASYQTPAGEITPSILAGGIKIRARTPRNELFNAVQGTYVDPNKQWQPTNFPPITNSTYEAQDGGERIYKDIELPYTNHPEMAQRISKILLEKARQGIIVDMAVTDSALQYCVFDVVTLTNSEIGWASKPFRILNWQTSSGGEIRMVLQEESSASYDWNNGEATTVDTAPDTNLPNPFIVMVPTGVSFSSRTIGTVGGDTIYSLILDWDEHSDQFVRESGFFEIQYKLSSETDYRPSFRVGGSQITTDVIQTGVGVEYDLRIRAINNLGVRSNWVTIIGALAGSSGGVGTTEDWELVSTAPATFLDWDSVAVVETLFIDREYVV